ncbi:hypothetical protein LSH36_121g05049 [Paralvinella palmiformis]|uniref:Uncharacterized protein n=1 Tax=Paralvinella palmiformis TaxID=53620 RepID=A0AAD9JXB3_9ANNE|nr:hypothetical protein LSH36_121g05049 [Paralvinella palmiformis]
MLQYAKDNGIHVIRLPPHTSHKAQALDRSAPEIIPTSNRGREKWKSMVATSTPKLKIFRDKDKKERQGKTRKDKERKDAKWLENLPKDWMMIGSRLRI